MAKLVAKRYSDALFELALEEDKLDTFLAEIEVLTVAFQENEQLTKLMNHPKIDKEEKQKVMGKVLRGFVSDEIAGFFHVMIAKDRFRDWKSILGQFVETVKEYKNIGTVYVTVAMDLNDEQKKKVHDKIRNTTKYEKVDIKYQVDKSIIGGMIIRIGDRVVDSSIQTKLYELTKNLTKIQLA